MERKKPKFPPATFIEGGAQPEEKAVAWLAGQKWGRQGN